MAAQTRTRRTRTAAAVEAPVETQAVVEATAEAAEESKEQGGDLSRFLTKEPSDLHRNMAAWIKAETGYEPDLKTVQIVCALRHTYQKSDANQKHLADRKTASASKAEERKAARLARLQKQAEALGVKVQA